VVSVIIPTCNAMPAIEALVASLKGQTVPCEIVVIDSASEDGTARAARSQGARVLTIPRNRFNHGGTRNFAAMESSGDVIVFLTQDVLLFDEKCIENLVRPLDDVAIAAAFGRQVPRDDAKPTERFARYFNYPEAPAVRRWDDVGRLGIKTFFFSNACSAVRRKEFKELGGFPENLIMFEDMLYAAKVLKAGYSIAYAPGAMVVHSHDYGWIEQFRRYAQAGRSFSAHPWFVEYARGRSEGILFLKEELRWLQSRGMRLWCLYALGESLFKYAGYNIGLRRRGKMETAERGAERS
jgi:rhamnosyltransferase